jgi:hypothetical protein
MYAREMTLAEARAEYFRRSGFGDQGGYDERWIKVKVWRIPIWLPNTSGRIAAVKLHDLHHVLTEYPTTWRGEAEISAWEVGSGGLRRFWAGWWLDLMNVAQGLVINPLGVYRAFMRGRRTSNLFGATFSDEMLQSLVGEYRDRLDLEKPGDRPGLKDKLTFAFWVAASILLYIASVAPLVAVPLLVGYAIFVR